MKRTTDVQRLPSNLSVLTIVTGALFVALAFAVTALPEWIQPFDDLVGRLITGIDGSASSVLDVTTFLGDRLIIWPITVGAILIVTRRCRSLAVLLAVSAVSAMLAEVAVKFLIDRPRPGTVGFLASFPSGHVMAAVAWWGLVPAVAFVLTESALFRRVMLGASVVIVTAVAVSRVSLGAHWATDVMAGALLGVVLTATAYRIAIHARSADCQCLLHSDSLSANAPHRSW